MRKGLDGEEEKVGERGRSMGKKICSGESCERKGEERKGKSVGVTEG